MAYLHPADRARIRSGAARNGRRQQDASIPPATHRLGDLEGIENVLLAHRLDARRFVQRQRRIVAIGGFDAISRFHVH